MTVFYFSTFPVLTSNESYLVPCPPGEVSRIGLQPCFPCPDGFYQPHKGEKSCFRCPENSKTGMQGAKNVSACEGTVTRTC